jgi:hypothetical protein
MEFDKQFFLAKMRSKGFSDLVVWESSGALLLEKPRDYIWMQVYKGDASDDHMHDTVIDNLINALKNRGNLLTERMYVQWTVVPKYGVELIASMSIAVERHPTQNVKPTLFYVFLFFILSLVTAYLYLMFFL